MDINRNEIMALKIIEKDIVKVETDLKFNSFYNESDKRAVRTYIGSMDSREIGKYDTINALEISKEIIKRKEINNYQDYLKTHESLLKSLKDFG